jgi:hypothetical protein
VSRGLEGEMGRGKEGVGRRQENSGDSLTVDSRIGVRMSPISDAGIWDQLQLCSPQMSPVTLKTFIQGKHCDSHLKSQLLRRQK